MNLLVTGATGFVGSALFSLLLHQDVRMIAAVIAGEDAEQLPLDVERVIVEPLSDSADYSASLVGVDTVIHLAARVHKLNDTSPDPLTEFRKVNVDGTAKLARTAAKSGVSRFVFISSVKVHGEETTLPYTPESQPKPSDFYGISKWEAEQALRKIEAETGLEVVILRSPLVYGAGVKANFFNLMTLISQGVPFPLATVRNTRSLIYVGNLVDALVACTTQPVAAGQTYLVSDGEDVSTPELIRRIASALGVSARLFPFPPALIRFGAGLIGKGAVADRLLGSLMIDSSKIRNELGWTPPFTMDEGLRETAEWFKGTGVEKAYSLRNRDS